MADNFGLKIGIEGEKDFKNALRDINSSFKVLGSEMNLVSSEFDKNDRSMESLTARNRVLNKEIDTQTLKIETLQKALDNASASFGENDKRTLAWQVQLNNAKADLNGLEKELKQNDTALGSVGNEFNSAEKQSEQFDKALKTSSDTADKAESRFSNLGNTLGKIGVAIGAGVVAIGAAAVSAGKALANTTVSASEYADEILTQATVTGMSTESLQAYKYAAELIDTPMETVTATMSKNIKSMASARDGSKATADAYKALGISVTDASGNLKDGETVYWQAIDALGKMQNETERDALAMQIFGKSARELNPLIEQGSSGMAKLTDEAKRMGAVMSEDALSTLGKFDDSMQRLKSGAGAAQNVLGTVLLPQLQLLTDSGTNLLGEFTKGISDANGDWGKISEVIGNTVGGLVNILMDNLPKIIELGLNIVKSIGQAIIDNLPMIIDAAVNIVMTLLQGLVSALPEITKGALQLVLSLLDGIIQNLPAIVEAALLMVVTLAQGIADALPELIPKIVDAVILIVETLIDNIDMLIDASIAIIMALAEGLITALPILIEKLPVIIDKLIVAITDNLPKLLEMGIILILKLAEGLLKAIPQLIAKIPTIIASLISGFASLYSKLTNVGIDLITKIRDGFVGKVTEFKDIGINMVKGLWEGIKNSTSWLLDKIKGFGADVMNGIKDFFGIHSPSTLMENQIGKNIGLGVASGITKSGSKIADALKEVVPTDMDAALSYNANFSNLPVRMDPIIDYNSLKRVFVEALKEMNLSVALDGYKVGEIVKSTIVKEVFA